MKKSMKVILMTSVLSTTLISGVFTTSSNVAEAKSFKDISKNYIYRDIINEMSDKNIISGYEDGTFKPNETITRKHAAALINRAVGLPKIEVFKQPSDLSTKNAYYDDLKALLEADLLEVDGKGNINPNEPLKRSEMAKILVVAFNLTGSTTKSFTDVSSTHEFYSYINTLYANNITTGDNGKFMPEKTLSRAHFSVFMSRAMEDDTEIEKEQIKDSEENYVIVDKGNGQSTVVYTEKGLKNYVKYAEMIDVFGMKKEDITRPKGVTAEKQNAEQVKIRVSEAHNGTGAITVASDLLSSQEKGSPVYNGVAQTAGARIEAKAQLMGISIEEFVEIANRVIKTGEVYNGGNFSMYYNYDDGYIYYSDRV